MTTLLVAHGTRNPVGVRMIGDLAAAVAGVLDEPVRVGSEWAAPGVAPLRRPL